MSAQLDIADGPALAAKPGLGRLRRFVGAVLAEPLLHFVVLGALLFLLVDGRGGPGANHTIVLDQARVDKFAADYRAEFGQDPSPVEIKSVAQRYVQDEILYREGLALNLDRDDEVIRRRIVQKMQFIQQDRYAGGEIGRPQLQAYYQAHLARYATPERVSFSHVYFGLAQGEAAAKARALAVLTELNSGGLTRAPDRGDHFSDLYDYDRLDSESARRLFGPTPIAEALSKAPVGHWSGPYRSAYGWHLVYVSARTPSATPPLDQVIDRVRSDVVDEQQASANAAGLAALRRRYRVVGAQSALAAP